MAIQPKRLAALPRLPVSLPDARPAAAQDAHALLERLFAKYQTAILNYLYRLVGDAALAEDLTQETFARAWQSSAKLP